MDFKKAYKNILTQLPHDFSAESEEEILLNANFFKKIKTSSLFTKDIVIQKTYHYYDNLYRAELLDFYFTEETCRTLGIFLLHFLFDSNKECVLQLTNPHSFVKKIKLVCINDHYRAQLQMQSFLYQPLAIDKYEFIQIPDPLACPRFFLSTEENINDMTQWETHRNELIIQGTMKTLISLAESLLNLGIKAQVTKERQLETSLGFGGVHPNSAEVIFWLPNSFNWNQCFFS